jgi:hypothetical protein
MLLGAVGIARDCQRDHRRNDTDHGEEGKRREISDKYLEYIMGFLLISACKPRKSTADLHELREFIIVLAAHRISVFLRK